MSSNSHMRKGDEMRRCVTQSWAPAGFCTHGWLAAAPGVRVQGKDEGDALPRSARGRPLRPSSQRADSDSNTGDDEPPSPSVTLPRCARLVPHHPVINPVCTAHGFGAEQ